MCLQNALLSNYCTYRIGGRAKYVVEVNDEAALLRALELCPEHIVIGRGSKLLFGDGGFDGTVIVMRSSAIKFDEESVCVDAGVSLPKLVRLCEINGFGGLEWAGGIPASVGGAIKMNAGAFGGDMSQAITYVNVLRGGRSVRIAKEECGFGYRHSGFLPSDIILSARLRLTKGDSHEIRAKGRGFAELRARAQPKGYSCGSIFKAAKKPAWEYIDACSLKGLRSGGAVISPKHCNFILNRGDAKAKDVLTLIRTVKAEVFTRLNTLLCEEVILAGDFN